MRRVHAEFRAIHGRSPSDEELADALSMTTKQLATRKRELIASDVGSLNSLVRNHEDGTVEQIDVLASEDTSLDPLREAAKGQAKEHFRRAFAQLDRREREVAVLLYVKSLTLSGPGRCSASPRAASARSTASSSRPSSARSRPTPSCCAKSPERGAHPARRRSRLVATQ